VQVGDRFDVDGAVSIVTPDATIKIPMAELVDIAAEKARLAKEKDNLQKQLDSVMARLNNKAFTDKAPAAVVENNRATAAKLQEQIHLLDESIAQLG